MVVKHHNIPKPHTHVLNLSSKKVDLKNAYYQLLIGSIAPTTVSAMRGTWQESISYICRSEEDGFANCQGLKCDPEFELCKNVKDEAYLYLLRGLWFEQVLKKFSISGQLQLISARPQLEALFNIHAAEKQRQTYSKLILRPWQENLLRIFKSYLGNDRAILWIYSKKGGEGKTTFSSYISCKFRTLEITNGKTSDIAFCYSGQEVVIFDFSRMVDHPNYQAIESLKNGKIFSGKYTSQVKIFTPPMVLIFANRPPDIPKLSVDRWRIYEIERGLLVPHPPSPLADNREISWLSPRWNK